ncbi:Crp/Fnr family transcriptional regulator [Brevibacillus ruminantium]|uniref:Crp/Fnr family transcriptional regulator n=1 Tax=Brevibacillus ruminantium TaxID=2950604 RepID=A0ABY4WL47_9BACL|nr:Crp/Fnr family transcriptional regulator [Brevibacillus ruminantium]USG66782.1 Crp/Fnr family transcriptional regulator [Brevibacillus ruminantium]
MRLNKGDILFRQGESGPLYHIRTGLLKVVRLQEDGSPFLFNLLLPGEMIPHHSLLTAKEYHGTAIALMSCEVDVIPSAEWYRSLEENPYRYREIALLLQSKLRFTQQRMDQLTASSPSEKWTLMQEWFAKYVGDYPLTELLTQEEIGQFLGLRRETVNRLLRKQI